MLSFRPFLTLALLINIQCLAQLDTIIADIPNETGNISSGRIPSDLDSCFAGREKTAKDTLTVLCVFVRFADDCSNTQTWPNYRVLPQWAATLVDSAIPSNGVYSNLNLSNFF